MSERTRAHLPLHQKAVSDLELGKQSKRKKAKPPKSLETSQTHSENMASSASTSLQQNPTAGTSLQNPIAGTPSQNPIVGTPLQNPTVGTSSQQNSIAGTSSGASNSAGTSQQQNSIVGTSSNANSIAGTSNTQQPPPALSNDYFAANAFQNNLYTQAPTFTPSSTPLTVVTSQLEGFYARHQDAYRGRKFKSDRRRMGDWPGPNAPPYRETGTVLPLRPAYDLSVAAHRCSMDCEDCPGSCPFKKTEVPPGANAYGYGQQYAWAADGCTIPKYPTGQEQYSVPSSGDESEEQRRARQEQLESVRVARYKTQKASERELHFMLQDEYEMDVVKIFAEEELEKRRERSERWRERRERRRRRVRAGRAVPRGTPYRRGAFERRRETEEERNGPCDSPYGYRDGRMGDWSGGRDSGSGFFGPAASNAQFLLPPSQNSGAPGLPGNALATAGASAAAQTSLATVSQAPLSAPRQQALVAAGQAGLAAPGAMGAQGPAPQQFAQPLVQQPVQPLAQQPPQPQAQQLAQPPGQQLAPPTGQPGTQAAAQPPAAQQAYALQMQQYHAQQHAAWQAAQQQGCVAGSAAAGCNAGSAAAQSTGSSRAKGTAAASARNPPALPDCTCAGRRRSSRRWPRCTGIPARAAAGKCCSAPAVDAA